jgi:hypothetical protein
MRIAVVLLACLGAGALTSVLADPTAETQPAATAAPSATPAAAEAAAPATSPTASKPAAPEIDPVEKHFLAEGYKPAMRRGVKVFCRREDVLGSRLGGGYVCATAQELESLEAQSRQAVEHVQQNTAPPSGR